MNLSWIDWAIMGASVIALRFVSLSTRRYMRGVADFLSANRTAGRYLLTIASDMGRTGTISFVMIFQMYYSSGLPTIWWGYMLVPLGIVMLLTGWVFYRFRETQAMTMAQFLEMRYSRRFRIFAGMLCWATGVLNFAVFPAVAARFLMYFCGLPEHFSIPGTQLEISTFATVMALDLLVALTFVNMGGQVSVMVTECVQGMFCGFAFIIVSAAILVQFQWPTIVKALSMAPTDASMIHPFHTSQSEFNIWFYLIAVLGTFYNFMSWQGTQGFNSSAKSPHEQKMGGIIGGWRGMPQGLMTVLIAIAAYAIMHLPEFSGKAAAVNAALKTIDNEAVRNQMLVPLAAASFLPIGIKGLLATVMLFASFTCHDTYMHSWGSIFIQDVYLPIKNKALSPEQHIKLLRWSIIFVALFAFAFSLVYQPSEKIVFYFAITGTIWMGGSGAVIIGGLYWRRGTTLAAYCALILGAILGVAGLVVPKWYSAQYHHEFPINGQWLYCIGMLGAILVYIVVSLLTSRGRSFNIQEMLHRGDYADEAERLPQQEPQSKWHFICGITKEFSRTDKILAQILVIWSIAWFVSFIAITAGNIVFPQYFGYCFWSGFWRFYVILYLCISVPATIWFTVGGVLDIKFLFRALETKVRDHTDDGRVVHRRRNVAAPQPRTEHMEAGSAVDTEESITQ